MSEPITTAAREEQFWFERPEDDFPYYRWQPVSLTPAQWWLLMAAVAVGYLLLGWLLGMFRTGVAGFIPALLFVGVPIGTLILVAGSGWRAIFRPLRGMDFVWILGFFLLNVIVTMGVGLLITSLFETVANPAGSIIAAATTLEKVLFFIKAVIQLFGEELFTILPFLALMAWLSGGMGMGRKKAVLLSALAVSVLFAAIHLPTYDWNVPQAMIGLVPVRLVLLLPYLVTKNIWVSTGVHVLNDWFIFGLPMITGSGAE